MASDYLQEKQGFSSDLPSPLGASHSTSVGSVPRSNALSSRITSVLSQSYGDLEIRDALETLDARGIENTPETRRNLRLEVQQEVVQCNGEIVQDFGRVAEQLKRIGSVISKLNKCCVDMHAQISSAKKETGLMLEEATNLLSQKHQAESKQQLLDAFNTHFLISDDDLDVLTSMSEPINDQFFRILLRVKKVHQDCQLLLGTEDQRLGLEILEQSSKQLNAAFQKLYRSIQKEFKTLDLENPQISASIRRSLRVLAERPQLFQNCLDFFAEAREHTLSDSFFSALTGQSSDPEYVPATKPIEFHSHDPLRYIGDMLAWAHSATVSEREALEVLFVSEGDEIAKGIQAGIDSDPWSRHDGSEPVFDGRQALKELVGRDLSGVSRLLRQRTEQVIQSHEDAALAYKIANLVSFYKLTFQKLLGDDAVILDVFDTLEKAAIRQFRANMRDHVAALESEATTAPVDLSTPDFLKEALELLKGLMKSYDTSLAAVDNREDAFEPVLSEALDPFMKGCKNVSRHMPEPDKSIFAMNCMLAAQTTLSSFIFTRGRVADLASTIEKHASTLTEYQHRYLVHTSGLQSLIAAIVPLSNSSDDLPSIATLPAFQPEALMATSQQLDDFLPSALMDATDNIKRLQSASLIQEIMEEAAELFCEDFEMVESRITAADEMQGGRLDEGEDTTLRELFPRTGAEIRVLLS